MNLTLKNWEENIQKISNLVLYREIFLIKWQPILLLLNYQENKEPLWFKKLINQKIIIGFKIIIIIRILINEIAWLILLRDFSGIAETLFLYILYIFLKILLLKNIK